MPKYKADNVVKLTDFMHYLSRKAQGEYMTHEKNIFESQYQATGFVSQRRYPNESLIAFLGGNYFELAKNERAKLKILDLGCGSGANLWMVAREGFDAYGVDYAETGLELCRQMLAHWEVKANLMLGDMTSLPYEDNYFDVVYDVVSSQHLTYQQHQQAYREVYRCLKPGGRFFSYHLGENSISLKSSTDMIDHCTIKNIATGYPLANNGQTCFLSANEARHSLGDCGFVDVIVDKVSRSYSNQTQYIEYLSIQCLKL